jgi:hypothetical protein
MTGVIPHLIVGIGLFGVGEIYYKRKSLVQISTGNHILLAMVCLGFSIIPDFPLGLYYIFHINSFEILLSYHVILHTILTPISLIGLVLLKFIINTKSEPIWTLGLLAIIIHITMDLYIHEGGLWI